MYEHFITSFFLYYLYFRTTVQNPPFSYLKTAFSSMAKFRYVQCDDSVTLLPPFKYLLFTCQFNNNYKRLKVDPMQFNFIGQGQETIYNPEDMPWLLELKKTFLSTQHTFFLCREPLILVNSSATAKSTRPWDIEGVTSCKTCNCGIQGE